MLENLDKFSLPEVEEKVLKFWKESRVFEMSLKNREKAKQFVFYEGPPTANGRPGIHHVLSRSFKDIILRYKTMAGYYVPRRAGWDTHGLPVEIEVEKKLGLRSKKEIEKFGIAAFNEKCKESVWQYKDEWERLTERMGFWLDMSHPYVTYANDYIESVWSVLKEAWNKKLLYKGHKIVPWCPRCGTALSSHELAQGYKEATDTSVYIKFRLKKGQKIGRTVIDGETFILSWTTTPWTLPGNVALAVGKNIDYQLVKVQSGETFILAKPRLASVLHENFADLGTVKGEKLVGLEYEPLFDIQHLKTPASYKVYEANFVTTEDGTGVVHTAVMYGEDDYELGVKVGLPTFHTVTLEGKFIPEIKGFAGLYVKAPETETKILEYLKKENRLFGEEKYTHDYPFCWRCGTPLIYYARDSWFIGMSRLKGEMLGENAKINWVPETIKTGRFGEWLRDVKDWAISRERYWGTPLPVWTCEKCGHAKAVGSIDELASGGKSSGNRYILMRHGEAEQNVKNIIDSWPEKRPYHLTARGRAEVKKAAASLKKEKIDLCFSSDLTRTKETAEIMKKELGLKGVKFDRRLREINAGDVNGHPLRDYHALFRTTADKFTTAPKGGETLADVRRRAWDFVQEIEKSEKGKTILVIGHEHPLWMLASVLEGWDTFRAIKEREGMGQEFAGELMPPAGRFFSEFRPLPRNGDGEADLHRPYVDAVSFKCDKCGAKMKRASEVIDVWFDSGAMPFAEDHYPFEKLTAYPADYIVEGIDQTRGWFYTLLAVATILGRGRSYKNVVSLGLVLDKSGQKMSKSKGNIVSPWEMMDKHGVDAVRWYFYTVNPPGEPKKFDEAELSKNSRQFFTMLYNSYVFYKTYADRSAKRKIPNTKYTNVLDAWIMARLAETAGRVTKSLDHYDVNGAANDIERLVDDLSRWYIRRSRRRFQKPEDKRDYAAASAALGCVLTEVAKLIAPFTPFFADALYLSLDGDRSVHLADWPAKRSLSAADKKLIKEMGTVRDLASAALAKRAELGIKVRQPLSELTVKAKIGKELAAVLADEINVKRVKHAAGSKEDFVLNTEITHELREEGWFRELSRMVQGLRQDAGLEPKDKITLMVSGPEEIGHIVTANAELLKREVNAKSVEFGRKDRFDAELETKLDDWPIWLGLLKSK
ncbi:class I tRNA ligase family protein [Patescibacteria group bacterium]|nr:class I tRNA ligase family protein [Patescibacteria group bacterium]